MKILAISLAGIGDTLIATPLLHELRANFPGATLDAFVLWMGSKDLLEGNPHLNRVHQFNLMRADAVRSLRFVNTLRNLDYDVSINIHPQSRLEYRMIARLIGAPLRLSHRYDNSTFLDRVFVNRIMPQDYSVHGVENNLRLLRLLGKQPVLPEHAMEVFLNAEETTWASNFLTSRQLNNRRLLGVHVGSGGTKNLALKRWPLDCYQQLIRTLLAAHPTLTVLLFGGPEEKGAHAEILHEHRDGKSVVAAETKNLRQAAALLSRCDGFISVDTALMHLAAAMKVRNQVVIEAPTLNATNVPFGNPYRLVTNPAVHGRNLEYYRYDGGPIRGTAEDLVRCMRAVTPQMAFEVVNETLTAG